MILLKTNHGEIKIELDHDNAPISSKNFEQYVSDGFYDGLVFHRVISNFMIQGGGFKPGMEPVQTREPTLVRAIKLVLQNAAQATQYPSHLIAAA